MGYVIGRSYDGKLKPKNITEAQKKEVADHKTENRIAALFMLLALAVGMRKLRDDEVYAFGYIPFFLLATASYYYSVARITLIVLHAQDLSKWRNRIGLSLLFGLEVFCNYAEVTYPKHRVYLVGHLSWGLTAYVLLMATWLLVQQFMDWRKAKNDLAS